MQCSFEDIYDRFSDKIIEDHHNITINLSDEYDIIKVSYNEIVPEIFTTIDENNIPTNINMDDRLIMFDANTFITRIYESYSLNINKIYFQHKMDFHRSIVNYNNHKIIDGNRLLQNIDKYKKYKIKLSNVELTLKDLIVTLCTQASFAFSFSLMVNLYNDIDKGHHVNSKKVIYNIDELDNNIYIKLQTVYELKDIYNDKVIAIIRTSTNIDILFEFNTYHLSKLGIISWSYQDIH